jgi:chromosome segregation ATPase
MSKATIIAELQKEVKELQDSVRRMRERLGALSLQIHNPEMQEEGPRTSLASVSILLNDLWEDVEYRERSSNRSHLDERPARFKSIYKPSGAFGWGDTIEEARTEALG